MAKEEIQNQIAELKVKNEKLISENKLIRQEFAKAFNWGKQNYFDRETEYREPSWEEIFVQIGKLLATKSFPDFEGNISELECVIEDIQKQLKTMVEGEN